MKRLENIVFMRRALRDIEFANIMPGGNAQDDVKMLTAMRGQSGNSPGGRLGASLSVKKLKHTR